MADHVARRFCSGCDAMTRSTSGRANHVLHLLMSIVTGGLWLIVWLFVALGRDWRCDDCGGRTKPRAPRRWRATARAGAVAALVVLSSYFSL